MQTNTTTGATIGAMLKSGPQDVKEVPFSTEALDQILNHGTTSQFDFLVGRAKDRLKDMSWYGSESYRLGQFTSNLQRIGKMRSRGVPGVRRITVDYAANAFQTITGPGLKILCEEADKIVAELEAAKAAKDTKDTKEPAPQTANTNANQENDHAEN